MGVKEDQRVQDYIKEVCKQIRYSKVHTEIGLELKSHMEEIIEECLQTGVSYDEAVKKAITQMGDPITVGKELNLAHKPQPEWSILMLAGVFVSLNLILMYLIQTKNILVHSGSILIFTKTLTFTVIGIIIAIGFYYFDYTKLKPYSKHVYLATLLVLLLSIHTGKYVHGFPYLKVGPVYFKFTGVSNVFFSISLAGLFTNWNWNEPKRVLQGLLLFILPIIILMQYPDFASCVIYVAVFIVLAISSGVKIKHILLIAGMAAGTFLISVLIKPNWIAGYRIRRFLTFINPYKDPEGAGYIYVQLRKLIGSAGFFGQGFSHEPLPVPDIHTDYIFTYIIYTFGWIAGIVTVILILSFILRGMKAVSQIKNDYGKMLVQGFVVVFAIQFAWNILMNLGLVFVTGFSLPFISYGGTWFVMNMMMIGLISNVYKQRNIVKASA